MSMVGKNYNKDEQILKILGEARKLKISPDEAREKISKRLEEYFPSIKAGFQKASALERLTEGFYSSGAGMATPLIERYALAHGLSGKIGSITPCSVIDEEICSSVVRGLDRQIKEPQ